MRSPVTVVVVTWNGAHLLGPCLESLSCQTMLHRVVVVDNASTDDTPAVLARFPLVDVVRLSSNTGFAGGAAAGLAATDSEIVAFLNNDAVAEPGWLAALVTALEEPSYGAVTSRLLLADDGRINNAGVDLTKWAYGRDRGYGDLNGPLYDRPAEVAAFCGGACAVRASAALDVGGFSPEFFLYYEDVDLSWRMRRAGWRIAYVPQAVVHHEHSATSDQTSAAFAFYNQRNQLLTVLRNAPLSFALLSMLRFVAISFVRAVRPRPEHQARPSHRWRVLVSVVGMSPWALRSARQPATLSRRTVTRAWLGRDARLAPY